MNRLFIFPEKFLMPIRKVMGYWFSSGTSNEELRVTKEHLKSFFNHTSDALSVRNRKSSV